MFCIHCGKKLEEDMKYCIYCGARQEEVTEEKVIPETVSAKSSHLLVLQDVTCEDRIYASDLQKPAVMGREAGTCAMLVEHDKSVSRKHCEFFWKHGTCYVRDLESFNGTFLNGEKIRKATPIKAGDILKLGGTKLIVAQCDME